MPTMLTIILPRTSGGVIEIMHDSPEAPHVVVIDTRFRTTDSPGVFTRASESEQAEEIAVYRNDGYEDLNP